MLFEPVSVVLADGPGVACLASRLVRPRVLDLYAGAGGLSTGLVSAGFDVVAGADTDSDAITTFAHAHADAEPLAVDVGKMNWRAYRGKVDVLAGGPPCQPWSVGGLRLGAQDPRDGWPGFLKALSEVKPEAFLAENVAGLATNERRQALTQLLDGFASLGFAVATSVVNAADYGVPQLRRRLVIVGLRGRPAFQFPIPTHGSGEPEPWLSAGSVVGPSAYGESNDAIVTYARRPDLRPNACSGHLWNGGGRPLDLARPARTVLASMGGNKTPWVDTLGIVPEYHAHLVRGGVPHRGQVPGARRITADEAAAIQSFPKEYPFFGRRSSVYRQIGNAVAPRVAEILGVALRDQMLAR